MLITDSNTVNVYDSMFDELDQETFTIIKQIFHNTNNSSGVKIIIKNLQKQHGHADCGIFTIAVLTSLAYKDDLSTILYDQRKLREHLTECFAARLITLFPRLM